ncbi:acyltransferase family protein [Lactobacillus delbrueckii subsp. bulgaricus]
MNTNKFTISWEDFSRYRSSMFGLSIIGIMVFHYFEHIRSAHLLLKSEQFWDYYIGSTGVDFFLFLSGMGLFYSLTKNDDICQFYKKRLVRILPAYLLVSMPFFAWRDFIHLHTGILTFIRDLLFLNFIDHADTTYWFIFFIIVMYLLFSPLVQILGYREPRKKISPPPGRFSYLCPFFMGPFCFESRNLWQREHHLGQGADFCSGLILRAPN